MEGFGTKWPIYDHRGNSLFSSYKKVHLTNLCNNIVVIVSNLPVFSYASKSVTKQRELTHSVYWSCLSAFSLSRMSRYMKPISADAHAGKYESILLECSDGELNKKRKTHATSRYRIWRIDYHIRRTDYYIWKTEYHICRTETIIGELITIFGELITIFGKLNIILQNWKLHAFSYKQPYFWGPSKVLYFNTPFT